MDKFPEIKFKGRKYLLIDGAIATKHQYENGNMSYAHLYDDGIIKRLNKVIGTKEDVVFTGKKVTVRPTRTALLNVFDAFLGGSWDD